MPLTKSPLIRSLGFVLGCLAIDLQAQEERWYQVELLIFSHETGANAEQWEPLPVLAYPEQGRFLVYPQQVQSREEEHEGTSQLDEFGRLFLRPDPEPLSAQKSATDIPIAGGGVNETGGNLPGSEADEVEIAAGDLIPPTPTPFIALPRRSAEFYGKAAYMQRSGHYKTLFHETWVQPMREEASAIPLIIDRSGDTDDWPRLQGSVKLHIARYLHIETNLWLNTAGNYLPGDWQMPAPPLGPASLIIEEPETTPDQGDGYFVTEGSSAPSDEDLSSQVPMPAEELGPVYPWRHAVLLQQKRRMRSKEVHYIDHPMLGVIIKFMPLDDEQLQEMADAERAAQETAIQ